MLKFLFWILLFANAGLLAYEEGYLAAWLPDGREPERMAHQLNVDSMKPVAAALAESKPSADVALDESKAGKPDPAACSEIGGFDAAGAKRFESAVQTLALGDRLTHHDVEETAHNIVYIPSQGSKEGAEKKAAELRHLGVTDFYVIQDAGDLHWGISLGVFKTEESARALLAALSQKGVHSARLGTHNVASTKVAYQLHNLDAAARAGLDKVLLDFPHVEKHACNADAPSDAKAAAQGATATPPAKAPLPRDAIH
jgi:hypothetical protein